MTYLFASRRMALSCLSAALVASAAFAEPAAAQEYTMRANTVGNEESISYQGLERFKKIVEARSEGRIQVDLFHSGALGDQVSGIESMQAGTVDIATVETPIDTIDPVLGVTALPYMFRDRDHVDTVMYGALGSWIEKRLEDHGLRTLSFMEGGFRHITNNVRPIEKPEDLQGIAMRTPDSRLRIKIFNHYGADASPLPFPELYTALQTGVFDGQENPIIWVKTTNFYEVQEYLSLTGHLYTVTYVLMSDQVYQDLPEDLQLIVRQAGREAAEFSVEVGRAADEEIVDFLIEQGMEVNEADTEAFVAASEPIWDEWADELGSEDAETARMLIHLISTAGVQP